jgi:hypothetical protein
VVIRLGEMTDQPAYKTATPDWVEIWASPALGMRVARVSTHYPVRAEVWDVEAGKTVRSATLKTREASEFKDFGGGVFLPGLISITETVEATGTRRLVSEYRATIRSVNESLDDSEFDWTFPEHLKVFDYTLNHEHPPKFLWGADDQPLLEIKSYRDLEQFADLDDGRGRGRGRLWWWISGGVMALVVAGYVIHRRRQAG